MTTTTAKTLPLTCRGIHKYLGKDETRVHVLRGVELELKPATVYAIVGPSGCGKSTLLYLLGLLDKQDKGEITIAGTSMVDANDLKRTAIRNKHIGFVFQFHFLLTEFTALENVMLPMQKLGEISNDEMRERAEGLLKDVGLGEKTHRRANHLSGGEQQRVAVARALANNPTLLLADEPTGNLDAQNSELVFDLIRKLAHEKGQSALVVTHNPDIAKRCDHTFCMKDGLFVT